jgi:quaternary ammonium compound-resistance protein SugE
MSAWVALFIAGILEVGWTVGLKYTVGFTKPLPSFLTVFALCGSMLFLAKAIKELPIGTAYIVWVGIGALGAAIFGIVLFKEPTTLPRIFFLSLLMMSIIGLKLTA